MAPVDVRCTAIAARTKKRCKYGCVDWRVANGVEWVPISGTPPEVCRTHLSTEERRVYEEAKSREVSFLAYLVARNPPPTEPACWSWEPTTSADMERVKTLIPEIARQYISNEDWAELLLDEWQAGRCAICGHRKPLVRDHSHSSGYTRGLLCRSCNISEGMGGEGIFARYRELNPAVICGLRVRYRNSLTGELAVPPPPYDPWTDNPLKGAGL